MIIKHLAVIMDGNRRWAKKRSLMPWLGHKQGVEAVKQCVEFCLENKIDTVSLYTLSLENLKRSAEEVNYLFDLVIDQSQQVLPELIKNGVSITFRGNKQYWPQHVKPDIAQLEEATKDLTNLKLNILFCYGAQQEIVATAQAIAQDVQAGKLSADNITQATFESYLWNSSSPELIIRTGGEHRLSNFLLYQAAYSELYFTDKLWPDLTKEDFTQALNEFTRRKRNFGS